MDLIPLEASRTQKRKSLNVQYEKSKIRQQIKAYTDKGYLQKYSLYSNLFSSQSYSLSFSEIDQMNLLFGRQSVETGQLYEYSYSHRRDKKIILFFFIMKFLQNPNDGGKSQMVILENVEKVNRNQLRSFLSNSSYGGSDKCVRQFERRVIFLYSKNLSCYKFNLSMVGTLQEENKFLNTILVSDINSFEASDKLTQERHYKRLPKDILAIAFRRDFSDYKVIQTSSFNHIYQQEIGDDKYDLNEKILNVLKKKYENRDCTISCLIPIEYLGGGSKTIEDSYRTCLVRLIHNEEGFLEFTFKAFPLQIENFRRITSTAA